MSQEQWSKIDQINIAPLLPSQILEVSGFFLSFYINAMSHSMRTKKILVSPKLNRNITIALYKSIIIYTFLYSIFFLLTEYIIPVCIVFILQKKIVWSWYIYSLMKIQTSKHFRYYLFIFCLRMDSAGLFYVSLSSPKCLVSIYFHCQLQKKPRVFY